MRGFSGAQVYTSTNYNALGQVASQARPYFRSASSVYYTRFTYDILGRPRTVTAPDGSVTTTSYQGLTTSVTVTTGVTGSPPQTSTQIKNSQLGRAGS